MSMRFHLCIDFIHIDIFVFRLCKIFKAFFSFFIFCIFISFVRNKTQTWKSSYPRNCIAGKNHVLYKWKMDSVWKFNWLCSWRGLHCERWVCLHMARHFLRAFYHVWSPLRSSHARNYRRPTWSTLQRSIRRPAVRQTVPDTWTHPPIHSACWKYRFNLNVHMRWMRLLLLIDAIVTSADSNVVDTCYPLNVIQMSYGIKKNCQRRAFNSKLARINGFDRKRGEKIDWNVPTAW